MNQYKREIQALFIGFIGGALIGIYILLLCKFLMLVAKWLGL